MSGDSAGRHQPPPIASPSPVPEEALPPDAVARLFALASIGGRAAEVVHELRNSLLVVETSLHAIRRTAEGATVVADLILARIDAQLARMEREVRAAQALITTVLEDARSETFAPAPIDLAALVREMASSEGELGNAVLLRGARLVVDAHRVVVDADAAQIRRLVRNLVRNAADAIASARANGSDAGGMAGEIVLGVDEGMGMVGACARLRVDDDGDGVDEARGAQLFEAFATGRPEGTGLGLHLCKRIVDAHGGTIVLRRREPRGTSVEVVFPRTRAIERAR